MAEQIRNLNLLALRLLLLLLLLWLDILRGLLHAAAKRGCLISHSLIPKSSGHSLDAAGAGLTHRHSPHQ